MKEIILSGFRGPVTGEITPPPDKSVTHRALFLGAYANGVTTISNPLESGDIASTRGLLLRMGALIRRGSGGSLSVSAGRGFPLAGKGSILNCGNSGTTMALALGLLAGRGRGVVVSGDKSLSGRPVASILEPLKNMGAEFEVKSPDGRPPVTLNGNADSLHGIRWKISPPSAQVKSAVLLAGLRASGETVIMEEFPTRDHTERLALSMGADIEPTSDKLILRPGPKLRGVHVEIPGDISAAAPFMVLAALTPGSRLVVRDVGLNETRTGLLRFMGEIGVPVKILDSWNEGGEPMGDVEIKGADGLSNFTLEGKDIPSMIDEMILVAVLGAFASGPSTVRGAARLRKKESDRIESIASLLRAFGVNVETWEDGFTVIPGGGPKGGGTIISEDHRVIMSAAVMALLSRGRTRIRGVEWVNVSYPDFFVTLRNLTT